MSRRKPVLYIGLPTEEASIGLRLRDVANQTGVCPSCGALREIRLIRAGIFAGRMEHEDNCRVLRGTASDDAMEQWLKGLEDPE